MRSKQSKVIDVYNGEYITIWHDGEFAFVTVFPNSISFSLPLEALTDLFDDFAKARTIYQEMLKEGGK